MTDVHKATLPPPRPLTRLEPGAELREVAVTCTNLWCSPDAVVGGLDGPILAGDPAGWADALTTDLRHGLDGRVDTQLLLGEPVHVLEQSGAWSKVVAPWQPSRKHREGYPGWVRSDHLAEPAMATDGPLVVVTSVLTEVRAEGSTPVLATLGTVLAQLERQADAVVVALPGGQTGNIDSTAVRALPLDSSGEAVLAVASTMAGLGYLWGGLTAFGLDCSGLVHLSARRCGLVLPRDADDQQASARAVDAPQVGDLVFFGRTKRRATHVGIVSGPGRMLHAPMTGGVVTEEELSDERRAALLGAGRLG
jgi:cell wall-associated NlpC family hydrolase